MKRILCVFAALIVAGPTAVASGGGRSWAAAEVTREDVADGYSQRVGGIRVRVYNAAVRGGLSCQIAIEATPAASVRFTAMENFTLRFYDRRGRVLEARRRIGFFTGRPGWGGGTMSIGMGTPAPPAGATAISIELEFVKLETRKLPLPAR